jgi:hypothetical protein
VVGPVVAPASRSSPVNDFWDALPEIFNWMTSGAPIPQRALIQRGLGETPVRTRVLPMNIPQLAMHALENGFGDSQGSLSTSVHTLFPSPLNDSRFGLKHLPNSFLT